MTLETETCGPMAAPNVTKTAAANQYVRDVFGALDWQTGKVAANNIYVFAVDGILHACDSYAITAIPTVIADRFTAALGADKPIRYMGGRVSSPYDRAKGCQIVVSDETTLRLIANTAAAATLPAERIAGRWSAGQSKHLARFTAAAGPRGEPADIALVAHKVEAIEAVHCDTTITWWAQPKAKNPAFRPLVARLGAEAGADGPVVALVMPVRVEGPWTLEPDL